MTREELRDYVDGQRILNNIPYHVYSALIDGIDTLEQEPILDKIRAEIEGKYRVILKGTPKDDWDVRWNDCLDKVLEIIDKYIAEESEE